jgi:hypothetical protein
MPLQDLTKPSTGSCYRMLSPDKFGFGRSQTETVVIVDWTVVPGKSAEFKPIRVNRKETHRRYGVFENYSWVETPKSDD